MYRKQVRRRRAVLLLLVAASLTLLSLYYREGNGGPIHGVQRRGLDRLQPDRGGADRALKPARDLVNWFGETFEARGENDRSCRTRWPSLRDQLAQGPDAAAARRKELSALNELTSGGIVPDGHRARHRAGGRPLADRLVLDGDDRQGLERRRPGRRPGRRRATAWRARSPQTTPGTAQVTLITDADSSVTGAGDSRAARPASSSPTSATRATSSSTSSQRGERIARGPDGGDGGLLDRRPRTRSSRPASRSGRSPRPRWRSSRPTSGSTCEPFADLRDMDFVKVLTTHSGGGKG